MVAVYHEIIYTSKQKKKKKKLNYIMQLIYKQKRRNKLNYNFKLKAVNLLSKLATRFRHKSLGILNEKHS